MKHIDRVICMTFLAVLVWACDSVERSGKIVVEENFGLERELEYLRIVLPDHHENKLFLRDAESGEMILAEKLNTHSTSKDSSAYIFPISIKANKKKTLYISDSDRKLALPKFETSGNDLAIKVENESFVADFNSTEAKSNMGLFPGQLAGIFIKNRGILLKRGHLNMHWAPNFQKEGMAYKTIGHVNSENSKVSENNSYMLELRKTGNVPNYEEIDLFGQYNLFADLPYFEYTSTMTFNKETELTLLRNDEMTIDSLFTHLVYPNKSGLTTLLPLYDMVKFDSLTEAPLADDINWLGFINRSLNYGLISLRLGYDNYNLDGLESPLYKEHTKISASSGNGRYWNRRLIHEHKTLVPTGSRYYERNAYLVVDDLNTMESRIHHYRNRLMNPLEVSYSSD